MISNLHICYYQLYNSRCLSPLFMRCLYAVFGYKHFLTTLNYFRQLYKTYGSHMLLQTVIYYLWQPCTALDGYMLLLYATYGGYILLSTTIYYFRQLHITYGGYILLLALPDCDFVRTQDFLAISPTYGLKLGLNSISICQP